MLIVLVVILGVAVLVASVMLRSANKAAEKIDQKTDAVLGASDASAKGASGAYCVSDADCAGGRCDSYLKKCY
jgi:type II secretory pathway pseudopilin PulG